MTKNKSATAEVVVRALHTTQGESLDVYAFFVRGADIVQAGIVARAAFENAAPFGFSARDERAARMEAASHRDALRIGTN